MILFNKIPKIKGCEITLWQPERDEIHAIWEKSSTTMDEFADPDEHVAKRTQMILIHT